MVEVFHLHQAEHKNIHLRGSSRGGAAVARRAHNPKVVGSNPTPATKRYKGPESLASGLFLLNTKAFRLYQLLTRCFWSAQLSFAKGKVLVYSRNGGFSFGCQVLS